LEFLSDVDLDKEKLDSSDKKCRIIGIWVKKTKDKYVLRQTNKEYYYKLNELQSKINSGNLLTAPIHFKDVGIGGGERYIISGSNQKEKVLSMIGYTYEIRLIYGNKAIVGKLSSISENGECIGITTEDGYYLRCTLKNCDIEILND